MATLMLAVQRARENGRLPPSGPLCLSTNRLGRTNRLYNRVRWNVLLDLWGTEQ